MKRELKQNTNLLIYRTIYVPAITYGHELWIVIITLRLQIQVFEIGFLHRMIGLSLREELGHVEEAWSRAGAASH